MRPRFRGSAGWWDVDAGRRLGDAEAAALCGRVELWRATLDDGSAAHEAAVLGEGGFVSLGDLRVQGRGDHFHAWPQPTSLLAVAHHLMTRGSPVASLRGPGALLTSVARVRLSCDGASRELPYFWSRDHVEDARESLGDNCFGGDCFSGWVYGEALRLLEGAAGPGVLNDGAAYAELRRRASCASTRACLGIFHRFGSLFPLREGDRRRSAVDSGVRVEIRCSLTGAWRDVGPGGAAVRR